MPSDRVFALVSGQPPERAVPVIQQTRLAVGSPPWDYEPRKDASKQFVRGGNSVSATVVKGRARYPFVAPKPPDAPKR